MIEDLTLHINRGDGTTATYTTTAVLGARHTDRAAHHRTSLARLYGIPTSAFGVLDCRHTYSIDQASR